MKFLEFIHCVDENILLEAAKDRYMQMFQNLPLELIAKYTPNMSDEIKERIKWAMLTFKKSNAVTWWLRYYRLLVLKTIASRPVEPEDQEASKQAKEFYNKEVRRMGAKSGLGDSITGYLDSILNQQQMNQFEHFMSLPVPKIQNYPFAWQTPYDVINDFGRAEGEWQKELQGNVPIRDEHKPVLKFPDGSAWVDLGVAGCEEEGTAMGHCGNTPTQRGGQTVLSYRIPATDKNGNKAWKPRLTFILDTTNGMIGEMKGRNNNKPDKKYHGIIMELLKQPFIKGIVGGGYKPENNFKLSDLDEDSFDKMIAMKPALANPYDQFLYDDREVTQELIDKLDTLLRDDIGIGFKGYDEKNDVFLLADNLGNADDIFNDFAGYSSTPYIDSDEYIQKIMSDAMGEDTIASLARYFNNKYPNEEPIGDITSPSIVYAALDGENDVVIDAFKDAIEEYIKGIIRGNMEYQINSLEEYTYDSGSTGIGFDQKDDGTYRLVASPEEFLETDLPKVMGGEYDSWTALAPTEYLRDPDEVWWEEHLYNDEYAWGDLANGIISEINKNPEFIKAIEIGKHPGFEAEKEAGQQRLFASKGKIK